MKKAVVSFFSLGLLAAALLLGCANPSAPADPQAETPAATGGEWLYEPFTVAVQLGGGSDRSVAGPDAARIKGSHIRNYLQAVVVNQAGQIAGFADTRRTGAEELSATVRIDDLPLYETYSVMLLVGNWERNYAEETPGGNYVYTDAPPTLLATGLKQVNYTEDGQSVYIQLWPLYVDTVFTTSEASPAATEPVVSLGKPGAVDLLPVNWNVTWTVKEGKDSKGNGTENGFTRLIQAQKAANSDAGDTLLVKSASALLRAGSETTTSTPAISGNTVSASVGSATAGFAKIGGAGSVNFALEYVPFHFSAWTHPVWIIRNGLNARSQDDATNFALDTNWADGTANANGAVRYTVAAQTAAAEELAITAGKFEGPGSSFTPDISFTTAGYSGDAEAYYALVPKGSGAPAYSAYKSLGNAAAGDHREQISIPGKSEKGYDVYVILFKAGKVSAPYRIQLTGYMGINGGFEPEEEEEAAIPSKRFVMVGHYGSAYSTDGGKTWTAVDMPGSWHYVAYGEGTFVAINSKQKAAYSADGGLTWTETDLPIPYTMFTPGSLAYGDGKFVAGIGNTAAYSLDKGKTWTATTLAGNFSVSGIAYGNGKFVAVSAQAAAPLYSYNGIDWIAGNTPGIVATDVAFGDGTFVTASWVSKNLAYSSDGINWTEVAHPKPSDYEGSSEHGIAYGNGRFVIVGWYYPVGNPLGKGITLYSTNGGASWYEGSGAITPDPRVAYGDGVFVNAGTGSPNYSPDGKTWTRSDAPFSQGIAFGGE